MAGGLGGQQNIFLVVSVTFTSCWAFLAITMEFYWTKETAQYMCEFSKMDATPRWALAGLRKASISDDHGVQIVFR